MEWWQDAEEKNATFDNCQARQSLAGGFYFDFSDFEDNLALICGSSQFALSFWSSLTFIAFRRLLKIASSGCTSSSDGFSQGTIWKLLISIDNNQDFILRWKFQVKLYLQLVHHNTCISQMIHLPRKKGKIQ